MTTAEATCELTGLCHLGASCLYEDAACILLTKAQGLLKAGMWYTTPSLMYCWALLAHVLLLACVLA
jgi:hypothetical protein